jgi:hypothetical protein
MSRCISRASLRGFFSERHCGSPVSSTSPGECNAITNRWYGESDLTSSILEASLRKAEGLEKSPALWWIFARPTPAITRFSFYLNRLDSIRIADKPRISALMETRAFQVPIVKFPRGLLDNIGVRANVTSGLPVIQNQKVETHAELSTKGTTA